MKKTFLLSVLLLFVFSLAIAPIFSEVNQAGQSKAMKTQRKISTRTIALKRVTGTVRITTPQGQIITVSRGERMPVIAFGSQIQVLSGKAEVSAGGIKLVLDANQGINIAMNPDNGVIELATTFGSIGTISATVGTSTVALKDGSSLNVAVNAKGKLEINSIAGDTKIMTAESGRQRTSEETLNPRPSNNNNLTVEPFPPQQKQEESSPVSPKRR